ncbi:hypothetical protein [Lysobacter sp. TAB13]
MAEGVETDAEFSLLSQLGVSLIQGFLFAQPALACPSAITCR